MKDNNTPTKGERPMRRKAMMISYREPTIEEIQADNYSTLRKRERERVKNNGLKSLNTIGTSLEDEIMTMYDDVYEDDFVSVKKVVKETPSQKSTSQNKVESQNKADSQKTSQSKVSSHSKMSGIVDKNVDIPISQESDKHLVSPTSKVTEIEEELIISSGEDSDELLASLKKAASEAWEDKGSDKWDSKESDRWDDKESTKSDDKDSDEWEYKGSDKEESPVAKKAKNIAVVIEQRQGAKEGNVAKEMSVVSQSSMIGSLGLRSFYTRQEKFVHRPFVNPMMAGRTRGWEARRDDPSQYVPLGIRFNGKEEKGNPDRPYTLPYSDPAMQEEYKNFDYNSVPLGLRPRFNFRALMRPLYDPDREGALVLYRPSKTMSENEKVKLEAKLAKALQSNKEIEGLPEIAVVVDPRLAKVLRPHQVEGVKFLYDCVTGLRVKDNYGCIMADEMGLGKTLQCITLLWTLLKQSPTPGKATAERCVIACPSSLVNNWANELVKWLGKGRVNPIVCDYKVNAQLGSARDQLSMDLLRFLKDQGYRSTQVLIISYETLRSVVPQLGNAEIGLLLCDEGHRLKNSKNQTFQALNQLNVKRRVILSGTPIQNDLSEYFSILSFTNPDLLGSENEFRSNFENPILKGRDAAATQKDRDIGDEKLKELNAKVSKIIIRRTNDLLIKYLPTKYEHIVFCKLSDTQKTLYQKFINSKNVKNLLEEKSGQKATSLQAINILKKLVNHPSLLKYPEDIQGAEMVVPEYYIAQSNDRSARNAVRGGGYSDLNVEYSSKLVLLDNMLRLIRKTTTDKVVLISNYTQTLDMFEKLSKMRRFPFLRLDGSMTINKRQKLVDKFNDPEGNEFLFLLSSKAGGCGINLIGANRLFLFDPDWNPASDQQALARVWRDGQKKTCFIYRLIAVGTLEEKIFQRQSHKQALSNCVVDEEQSERHFSLTDLRELFKINEAECETHDTYGCKGSCDEIDRENSTYPDISSWSHFPKQSRHKLADKELKEATKDFDALSYVFQYKSHVSEIFKD